MDSNLSHTNSAQGRNLLIAASVLLGASFAAFFDGIVLHQILQWHHMLTSVRPTDSVTDLQANNFWDGIFLFGASVLTAIGLVLLWLAARRSLPANWRKQLVSAFVIGTGGFNVIEGVIDHHLLQIHHVKSGPNELAWDVGFLLLNAALILLGGVLLGGQRSSTHSLSDQS